MGSPVPIDGFNCKCRYCRKFYKKVHQQPKLDSVLRLPPPETSDSRPSVKAEERVHYKDNLTHFIKIGDRVKVQDKLTGKSWKARSRELTSEGGGRRLKLEKLELLTEARPPAKMLNLWKARRLSNYKLFATVKMTNLCILMKWKMPKKFSGCWKCFQSLGLFRWQVQHSLCTLVYWLEHWTPDHKVVGSSSDSTPLCWGPEQASLPTMFLPIQVKTNGYQHVDMLGKLNRLICVGVAANT